MEQEKSRKYFGREITSKDIELIRWVLDTYKSFSWRELIGTISEALEWTRQEDGMPRIWQCTVCLESLEAEGLIQLPEVRERCQR